MANKYSAIIIITVSMLVSIPSASASQLVYTPVNPDFGGNPANGPVLLNEANANNHFQAPPTPGVSTANLLEESIVSTLSTQITTKIFGSTNGQSGSYSIGNGGTISFVNNGATITITITDSSGTTVFTVPSGV